MATWQRCGRHIHGLRTYSWLTLSTRCIQALSPTSHHICHSFVLMPCAPPKQLHEPVNHCAQQGGGGWEALGAASQWPVVCCGVPCTIECCGASAQYSILWCSCTWPQFCNKMLPPHATIMIPCSCSQLNACSAHAIVPIAARTGGGFLAWVSHESEMAHSHGSDSSDSSVRPQTCQENSDVEDNAGMMDHTHAHRPGRNRYTSSQMHGYCRRCLGYGHNAQSSTLWP